MSAWLLFTSLGFYPVAPASNEYVIGRPFVKEATIHLANGKLFRIVAENLSPSSSYVNEVRLNGTPLGRAFIRHDEITAGGELRFVMGTVPNKNWATEESARPYSMSQRTR
jgi:putative alpha-1,2-mannosidase